MPQVGVVTPPSFDSKPLHLKLTSSLCTSGVKHGDTIPIEDSDSGSSQTFTPRDDDDDLIDIPPLIGDDDDMPPPVKKAKIHSNPALSRLPKGTKHTRPSAAVPLYLCRSPRSASSLRVLTTKITKTSQSRLASG